MAIAIKVVSNKEATDHAIIIMVKMAVIRIVMGIKTDQTITKIVVDIAHITI